MTFPERMTTRNNTGITPIRDQVLVRRDPPVEQSKGGLFYPQGSAEWPEIGTVLAIGPSVREPGLEPGTRVAFKARAGTALEPDTREGFRPERERVVVLRSGEADGSTGDIIGFVEDEIVEAA